MLRKKKLLQKKIQIKEDEVQKQQSRGHTFHVKSLAEGVVDDIADSTHAKKKLSVFKKHVVAKGHKSKENTQIDKIDRELTQIYKNEDGSLPDMKLFDKKKGRGFIRPFITLLFSLTFLSGAVWYAYTKFQYPTGTFIENDVILSISGEEEVSYGGEVRYRVRFKNAQSIPLLKSVIEIRYPAGFVFTTSSVSPDTETQNIWTLGELGDGDGEFIDIFGNFYGNIGEAQSFRVFLSYRPSNFSSTFQKVATQETRVVSSHINIALVGPKEISQGVASQFDVKVSPDFEEGVIIPDNIILVFDPGAPFVLQKMDPSNEQFQNLTWKITSKKEEKTFRVIGAFAGGISTTTVHATLFGWQEGQQQKDAYIIASASYDISIADEQLSIILVANGSQQDITVQPGENINATVIIKNSTDKILKDIRVRMMFDAPSIKNSSIMYWQGIEDSFNGSIIGEQLSDSIRRGQLTWSSQNVTALRALNPDESVSIDVSLPIKTREQTELAEYKTSDITIASDVQYDIAGAKETATAVPLKLTINSDTTFEVSREEKDGVYVVTWMLSNSFHGLKDIEAKVYLYGNIDFNPKDITVPAGTIEFNKDEQKLIWYIDNMPISLDILALQFPVLLLKKNPSQTQLTSKVTVTATDIVSGKQILLIGDEIGL